MKNHIGTTVIELMVVLAAMAIIIAFGVPRISGIIESNRIISKINLLSANLSYARSESVKRGIPVNVISNTGDTNWLSGWTVYVDQDGDSAVTAGEELRIVDPIALSITTLTGPNGNVIYNPDGSVNAVSAFTFDSSGSYPTRIINISITGKVDIGY